jgi:uncharacterized protein (DUF58 family)
MKRMISLSLSLLTCIGLALATERRAMAYIDPSQGLLFMQSLGAALAAAAYFLRSRILALFGRKKSAAGAAPVPVTSVRPVAVQPVTIQKGNVRNAA